MALLGRKDKTPLGIYVHIPFCRSKCQYCDFYSITTKDQRVMDGYLDAVCAHIKEAGALAPGYLVDTVYFGGGTPTFFGADALATILTAVRRSFDVSNDAEITFEANPDSVTPKLLRKLRSEGFNRVSLGIQCDDNGILDKIGRPHSYEQAVNAVKLIRRAGFRNLSLDLMYGLPNQTLESWEATLQNVLKLEPEHISCYGLKVEEGTPMHRYQEFMNLPDDDAQADMYLRAVEILRNKGFKQYEVSNFCRRNQESKHNLEYWTGGAYLGFGPDASSDFAGKRFSMIRDLRAYVDGILNGGQVIADLQEVPQRERAGEYIMMRLRTSLGIQAEEYEKRYLLPFAPLEQALEKCRQRGHAVKQDDGSWRLTPEGFLISNSIISDLQIIQDEAPPLAKRR
jgi:oxygen-independent coproporphyrinogen-3 oxidase